MKIIGVEMKGNLPERIHPINAITRVEFRQIGLQDGILKKGQDFIADEFIKGHAAF